MDVLLAVKQSLHERIPPVGASFDATTGKVALTEIDFRHLLTAGWVYWLGVDSLPVDQRLTFGNVNQLCDRGILQQYAVEIMAKG